MTVSNRPTIVLYSNHLTSLPTAVLEPTHDPIQSSMAAGDETCVTYPPMEAKPDPDPQASSIPPLFFSQTQTQTGRQAASNLNFRHIHFLDRIIEIEILSNLSVAFSVRVRQKVS